MKTHFLVFTQRLEHVGQPSLSWTVGVFETLSGAKNAARKYYSEAPKQAKHLASFMVPKVVVAQWRGHRKLRQWEREQGSTEWKEVLPF